MERNSISKIVLSFYICFAAIGDIKVFLLPALFNSLLILFCFNIPVIFSAEDYDVKLSVLTSFQAQSGGGLQRMSQLFKQMHLVTSKFGTKL